MAKFSLLYNGPATPPSEMEPDKVQDVMRAWQAWIENVGPALVDVGAPMDNGVSVVDDGSTREAGELNGYSIVEANDRDAAVALVVEHPFLSDKTGNFSVDVSSCCPSRCDRSQRQPRIADTISPAASSWMSCPEPRIMTVRWSSKITAIPGVETPGHARSV